MGGNEYIALATSPASASNDEHDETTDTYPYPLNAIPIRDVRQRRGIRSLLGNRRPRFNLLLLIATPTIFITVITAYIFLSSRRVVFSEFEPELSDHPGDNPYFSPGDIWKHNDAVADRLSRCASLGLLRNTSLPVPAHQRLSDEEEREYDVQGCGLNETTVIILSSLWFAEAYSAASSTGESVYAQSVISTLNANRYAYVFSSLGWWNHDMRKTVELWNQHRWNVRAVLADPEQINVCWDKEIRDEQKCLKDETNPDGIEAWRLLGFWYWDDPGNPLGPQFTLSPSRSNPNYFLSYSIEPTCRRLPYLPHSARPTPPQAYLLAKQVHYLDNTPEFSWTLPALSHLQSSLDIVIAGGMVDDDGETLKEVAHAGITNFGRLGKMEFYEALAKSFVLIGVGRPRISPSPWDALCMGVPFINPILKWDEEDPSNRLEWHTQHWHMTSLNPPYVYSVHAHDLDGLHSAVQQALENPIDSYIPDYMRFDYVVHRMAEVVEADWKGRAEVLLAQRIEDGEGALFDI